MNTCMQSPQDKALVSINIFSLFHLSPSEHCHQSFHLSIFWSDHLHLWLQCSAKPESLCVLFELARSSSHWERSNFALHLALHSQSAAATVARRLGPDRPTGAVICMLLSAPAILWLNWQHLMAENWGPVLQPPSLVSADILLKPFSVLETHAG